MKSVISESDSEAMSFLIWVSDFLCFSKYGKYLVDTVHINLLCS